MPGRHGLAVRMYVMLRVFPHRQWSAVSQGQVMLRTDTVMTAGGPRPVQGPWDHVIVLSDQRENAIDRIKRTVHERGQAAW